MLNKFLLYALLLFIAFNTFSVHAFKTGAYLPDYPQQCMVDDYYDCNLCPCPLLDTALTTIIVLYAIDLAFTLVIVIGYIAAKEIRELPGDFFLGMAVGQVFYSVASLVEGGVDSVNNMGIDTTDTFCYTISFFTDFGHRVVRSYHLCFMIYYLMSLRYSLRNSKIPRLLYHLIPWLVSIAFTTQSIIAGSLGKAIDGTCDTKSSPDSVSYIVEIGFCIAIFLASGVLWTRLAKHIRRFDREQKRHLKYYMIYFILANIILIATCIVKFVGSMGMSNYIKNGPADDYAGAKEVLFASQTNFIIDAINCVGVTLIRIFDPLLREHWKRIFFKMFDRCRRKRRVTDAKLTPGLLDIEMDTTISKPRVISITAHEVVASIKKKSFLLQIQHNYRVQVAYSMLASIHYYWRTEQQTKDPPSIDEAKDTDYYSKKAKAIFTCKISDKLIKETAPDISKELASRNYTVVEGKLTVYAASIFDEISNADNIHRILVSSLDLESNYNRVLKSGIAQGGSSGEFFFFSNDNRFIIKTISAEELDVLLTLLPRYSQHFAANPKSLIAKIYAAFTFEVNKPYEKYHFILMKNVNGYPSHCTSRKYDLKGSTVNRCVLGNENVEYHNLKYHGTLKDTDFDKYEGQVHISFQKQNELMETVAKDVEFLHSEGLIDYSLAIYLIDKSKLKHLLGYKENALNGDIDDSNMDSMMNGSTLSVSMDEVHHSRGYAESTYIPREDTQNHLQSIDSIKEEIAYRIGIIDYLNKYTWSKRMEKFLKQVRALNFKLDVSAQDSETYSDRFIRYMRKIVRGEDGN